MRVNFKKTSHILFFAVVLPALSWGLSWALYKLIPNPPFWLETISPLYAYTILYSFFEKRFWHWKLFKTFGIVDFPDLRGRWRGMQLSSHKENDKNVEVISYLEIYQTFSEIFIRSFYEKSQSESVVANFARSHGESYLFYSYDNEPNSLKLGTMQMHKGTVKLRYFPQKKLIGAYFNSIGNSGDANFEFEQSDLIGRFAR